jgi:hypothetical protein
MLYHFADVPFDSPHNRECAPRQCDSNTPVRIVSNRWKCAPSYTRWPDDSFDEVFQLIVMYPWLAPGGTLTFIPADASSRLLTADIEYAMWANPRSEVVYFG